MRRIKDTTKKYKNLCKNNNLPARKAANDNEVNVVQSWSSISTIHPQVYKMVMAALPIFCALKVQRHY